MTTKRKRRTSGENGSKGGHFSARFTRFIESEHPRTVGGRFTDKAQKKERQKTPPSPLGMEDADIILKRPSKELGLKAGAYKLDANGNYQLIPGTSTSTSKSSSKKSPDTPTRQDGQHADQLGKDGNHPRYGMGDDGETHPVKKVINSKVTSKPVNTKPQPARPGEGRLDDLRKVMDAHPSPGPERNKAIGEWVHQNASRTTTDVQLHGMSKPEAMRSIKLSGDFGDKDVDVSGMTLHYSANSDLSSNPVAHTLNLLDNKIGIYKNSYPGSVTRHTKNVYFTSQKSKDIEYYNKVMKTDIDNVAGTADNGDIVVYNGKHASSHVMAHEMGHNMARGRYGSVTPTDSSDFAGASRSGENPPTLYATNNRAEDFAESVHLYMVDRSLLEKKAPQRHRIIKRMVEDESYGG